MPKADDNLNPALRKSENVQQYEKVCIELRREASGKPNRLGFGESMVAKPKLKRFQNQYLKQQLSSFLVEREGRGMSFAALYQIF